MPQTCPHCGITLPAVVDAFCPECRADLSETPEEARKTAEGTFRVVKGALGAVADCPETRQEARATLLGYSLMFTGVAALGLVTSLLKREWELVILATVLLVLGVAWVRGAYRLWLVKTSVSGRGKTSKEPEQPQ